MTVGALIALPTAKDVRDLLEGLLGREVTVAPAAPLSPSPSRPAATAVYVDREFRATALCLVDLPLAAWCAGALALLPRGGVADAVAEGELSELHLEVLHEVVNVLASLLNGRGGTHSRLDRLLAPGQPLPGDLVAVTGSTNRLDLEVGVAGYGSGGLTFVLA